MREDILQFNNKLNYTKTGNLYIKIFIRFKISKFYIDC